MATKTIKVNIRVFIEELLSFYQWDSSYGTQDKPFPTESFYELETPWAKFTGPVRDILVFENDTEFHWNIESMSCGIVNFVDLDGDSQLDLMMITSSPSQEKWDKVLKNAPAMDDDGKLRFKPKVKNNTNSGNQSKKEFVFETAPSVPDDAVIKYSILFEFKDQKGNLKYGLIDPLGGSSTPPPPPPP